MSSNSWIYEIYLIIERTALLPFQTAFAATYLYPIYGIVYFAANHEMWDFYLVVLVPQLLITLAVYVGVFVVLYPIHATLLTLLTGPFGLVNAWFSVLQSAGTVAAFIVSFVMLPQIQKITFDAVLSKECADDVVLLAKLRRIEDVPFLVKCGSLIASIPDLMSLPYVVLKAVLMFLVGLIPFVGPILVVFLQAPSKGLQSQARYFVLLGYHQEQIKQAYRANPGGYVGFGIVANILESIPLLFIFFMFTNNLGAALWSADQEAQKKRAASQQGTTTEIISVESIDVLPESIGAVHASGVQRLPT